MNILVAGCGKVGSRLAITLSKYGHQVSVVDSDPNNIEKLRQYFDGVTVVGTPIDQDVLKAAGIESCDAVAAVTQDDNLNIMVSEIAKTIFGIDNVVTRIFDPAREDVFSHFGLNTVCPTRLTADALMVALTEKGKSQTVTVETSTLGVTAREVDKAYIGRSAEDVPVQIGEVLIGVIRADSTFLLMDCNSDIKIKEKDKIVTVRLVD